MGEEKTKKGKKSAEDILKEMFPSRTEVLWRSSIHLSTYNPRVIDPEARKLLKRSLKTYGVVGGIIVNERTGFTVVSGHQKVMILDERMGFSEANPLENDYQLKCEIVDMSETEEKRFNVMLNSPSAQGRFDGDKMRILLPDLIDDYQSAGLTEQDLNIIGVDFTLETEAERGIADALGDVDGPAAALREAEKAAKAEKTDEEKIAHNRDVKAKVLEGAQAKAEQMDAYVMLSFDTYGAKAEFMERFGYNPADKYIKGEVFADQVERVE